MNAVLTPHATRHSRTEITGDWRPFSEADRLTDKLKSPIAVEARRLYDDVLAQAARIRQIEQEARDTESRIVEAEAKLADVIQKDADTCGDGSSVIRATAERDVLLADALDPTVWRRRLDAARERLVTAESAHRQYLDTHALALVDELRKDAERVAKDRAAAYAKARKLLDGPEAEHNEITSTLVTLLGRTKPFSPADIPSQAYAAVPLPSEQSLAAYHALTSD